MNRTYPKGFKLPTSKEREYKDHEIRNQFLISLSFAIITVLAIGYFTGMFAWMHDMVLESEKQKAKIRTEVQAETSCYNLKFFTSQWNGYWQKPYSVEQAEQRMVELHC